MVSVFARGVLSAGLLAGAAGATPLDVLAVDAAHHPVSGVQVQLRSGTDVLDSRLTGADGRAHFPDLKPGRYHLLAAKDGFQDSGKNDLDLAGADPVLVELELAPALARRDSVDVKADASPVSRETSPPAELPPQTVKELPGRPATVADALPMTPGVVRQPGGGLTISAAGEHRSAFIVNSADVTDPATGQFGLTVPIDIVESLNVYQTPFLAEYGKFTAGVVSVETRRGGDRWKWELNDSFPDFTIRSYHLRGLRDATPRLNVEGPLINGKLYFSEGIDYEIRKTEVYELPFPNDQKKQQGFNSFTQLDWIASGSQLVTATIHVAPQRLDFVNMDYYNPQPATPEAAVENYTATVSDKLTLLGGVLANTVSFTRFNARVWGQGQQDFSISPEGNSGSYFAQKTRQASRIGWSPVFTAPAVHWLGTHNFKAGAEVAHSGDAGQVTEHPVDLLNASGDLFERIDFTAGQPFHVGDIAAAVFGQDHWLASPTLAFDLGIRTESQELSESFRVAPRAGAAWTPFRRSKTVFRGGFGLFYDRLPLNIYSFNQYPEQLISYFNAAGQLSAGPVLYRNVLGTVYARFPFVVEETAAGNFSPRGATGSFEVEQTLSSRLKLRARYLETSSAGLVVMNHLAPDPSSGLGANLLTGNGQARYRQFDITARLRWSEKRELMFSYVRSRARGDVNDFSTFLGTFALPLLRNNQFGNLPSDLPNRFLAWGLIHLPLGFQIAPVIELRSGFPYAVTDGEQNWVGVPYASRFPPFVSVDSRFSKDFKVSPKYTIRLSVSAFNLTDHFNPEAVHLNVADPAYGYFFGQRGRRFTADFDVRF